MWVDRITSGLVNILIATDATWVVDDITAALGADGVTFTVCREGRVVADQIAERLPDLAILDLQIGSMGGMAVTMSLRLDESADTLPHVPVLMLLALLDLEDLLACDLSSSDLSLDFLFLSGQCMDG